jgi:phage shock protein A
MADSLKTRVGRLIAGSVHALIDHIEDQNPGAAMEQSIREADGVIDEVRQELGRTSANRHLAQQQHARLNSQHADLLTQIDVALAQGREDLARTAVSRQLDIEAQIPVLETTLADFARQETELQGYVAALLAKKREMEDALQAFRANRAASQAATGASGVAPARSAEDRMSNITGAFDRIHQRQTGLSGTDQQKTLQQAAQLKELDDLVRDHKIAERMAQIKAGKA